MDKKEIIKLAEEAGMAVTKPSWGYSEHYHFAGYEDKIQRFAALVEQRTHTNNKARWYQEGVEAEREAIIKFFEYGVDLSGLAGEPQMQMFCATLLKGCADSIRARGNT